MADNHIQQSNSLSPAELAQNDALFMGELIEVLWQSKWLIVATVVIGMLIGGVWTAQQPNVYRSTVLLSPAENRESGLSGSLQSLGGLASLAGMGLPATTAQTKTRLALEVLKSREFLTRFIERHDLLPNLIAASDWDPINELLIYDDSLYDSEKSSWRETALAEEPRLLSLQRAYDRLFNAMLIEEESGGWVRVQLDHVSPYVAKQWLDWLVSDLNESIKRIEVDEAQRSIAYLNEQIEQTALTELKVMFYELIQAKTETVMLAQARPEYVFRIIDPPVVSETPAGPKRALVTAIFGLIALILAVVGVLARRYLRLPVAS